MWQVKGGMNNVREVVITTITPNGSAALPFVIPSVPPLRFDRERSASPHLFSSHVRCRVAEDLQFHLTSNQSK